MSRISDLDIAYAYNDQDRYPTLDDVAEALDCSVKTVKNRIGIIRRERGDISLISRISATPDIDEDDIPMNEKPQLFMKDWTSEDCISHLRELQSRHPDHHWTKNQFNKYSGISNSTWTRYFGTFLQFQRSANVRINRGAHQLQLHISKHAGADTYRAMNKEKQGYEGKYLKDRSGRWKTVAVISDVHDESCDPFLYRVWIDALARSKPDVIFLNGDIWDASEFGKYTNDPRTWDVVSKIKWLHKFLGDMRKASPESDIIYLEGNHEFRLLRHLAEATPALKAVLSDLHGFTVPKLLGLDEFEVNYIAKADLAAFRQTDAKKEIGRNYCLLWDMLLGHHFPEAKSWGYAGWNGHHHSHLVYQAFDPLKGSYEWHQLGAGHKMDAEYCNGEKWSMGFLLVHADTFTKKAVFEYTDVKDFAMFGGKFYRRNESEVWHAGMDFDKKVA